MDVFSHFVLPYLLVYAIRRRQREALAAGIGGFAPDLDAATAILSLAPPLFFLGHRGISHSLLGAPLYALGAILLLRAPFWRRILPVHTELRFGAPHVLLAMAASFTHLALDWLTMWGVPLLYPWTAARFSAGLFFYSSLLMLPFSMYFVWRIARANATDRTVRVVGGFVVAALLVAATARAATMPRVEADLAHPDAAEWAWTTFERTPEGWNATFWSWQREVGNATYVETIPRDPAGIAALETARAHVEYRAFHLYAGGPELVQVSAREDGGHNVTFTDLMVQAQIDRAPWVPFGDDRALLRLKVVDGQVEEI